MESPISHSSEATPQRLIVGLTGASGAIYGVRLLRLLRPTAIETHLVMSRSAKIALAQEMDLKELRLTLQQATNNLIEPGKEIFKLSREESLSHREIALKLNISVKTVEYHIGKAMRHFKAQLKDYL